MKKLLVFYFHGYASSPTTDKVARLKEVFPDTYAFPINIDPDVSLPFLEDQIENVLLGHVNDCKTTVVFVGTSLGAWYAAEMASVFPASKLILINPPIDTPNALKELGVLSEIADKYTPIDLGMPDRIFLADKDELFHYEENVEEWTAMNNVVFLEGTHRFNGPEFDEVIRYIETLKEK